ncbi:hypothetical protein EDB92DRAFT_1954368 [Lactarius akahatsu]|uniref:Uncharacterized protein n=1 Tax=Lactarius akahatsu TaxID=416441 RepID=A0AAD4Q335_9AGAM|nr:hypothetical protein EDB92DRAFT_1954368 [Lactarius akahatsu]
MTTVFFLGATGYIGDAVLSALVKVHPTLSVTALGSFTDAHGLELVERHARAADVVVNAACSDDLALHSAILAGQRKRVEVDGKPRGALVHTSGGAMSLDPSRAGAYDLNGEIWNDSNPANVRALTTSMVHGQVDIPCVSILMLTHRCSKSDWSCVPSDVLTLGRRILQAGEEGYVETHVIFPGGILATERQRACYFGEGTNMLYLVDVNDLADLYLRVFDRVLTGADRDACPYERYYIGAVNALPFKAIMTAIGESLARRTLLEDGTPESIAVDQVPDPWVPSYPPQLWC